MPVIYLQVMEAAREETRVVGPHSRVVRLDNTLVSRVVSRVGSMEGTCRYKHTTAVFRVVFKPKNLER